MISPGALLREAASAVNLVTVAGRTLLGFDTNPVPADWTHISKVDPEGEKRLPLGFPLYLSETSAVSVGGSQDVTAGNTEETMALVLATGAPMVHEPSGAGHVTEQTRESAELLAIPEVLNGNSEALVGTLGKGLNYVRGELGPGLVGGGIGIPLDSDGLLGERLGNFAAAYLMQEAVFEAYIIMNPNSAAAREAGVTESDLLSPQAARERALAAEYHLESEIVYLEYSGTFGGEEAVTMLGELDDALTTPRLWYGGGLDSAEKAGSVLDAGADAVVVGDVLHDIADVEADLVAQAREAFDENPGDDTTAPEDRTAGVPDHDRLVDWTTEAVDVSETSAMRYLSTIPEVDDAAGMATEYLAAGVEFALVVEAIADGLEDPDETQITQALCDAPRLSATHLARSLDDEQAEVPRRLAATLLADRFGVDVADAFSGGHLGIELSA